MRADLHVHSNASDGTDAPAEVIRRAARAGLDAVALTDHDTVAGHEQARRALPDSLTLLPGMELSCQLAGHSVHLLAYLFGPGHPELAAELARIRDDRVLRARAMVRRLAELGVDVSWDQVAAIAGPAVVGRPHIARAMAASGAIAEPREAFTREWIADGGRAYVDRYALEPVRRDPAGPGRGRGRGAGPPASGPGRTRLGRADRQAGRRRPGGGGGLPPRPARFGTGQPACPYPRSRSARQWRQRRPRPADRPPDRFRGRGRRCLPETGIHDDRRSALAR